MNLISTVTGDWAIFDFELAGNLCRFLSKKVASDLGSGSAGSSSEVGPYPDSSK